MLRELIRGMRLRTTKVTWTMPGVLFGRYVYTFRGDYSRKAHVEHIRETQPQLEWIPDYLINELIKIEDIWT